MWAKVDDQLHSHPKVAALWRRHPAAVGLHLLALSYCGAYLTDGRVPETFVAEKVNGDAGLPIALLEAGLWERDGEDYRIHDWLDFNPSKETVEKDRADAAERARRSREKRSKKGETSR